MIIDCQLRVFHPKWIVHPLFFFLKKKVESLLKGPSNLEEREGKIFIKSLNRFRSEKKYIAIVLQDEKGNIINFFNSIADCIKFLGLGRNLVYKRYKKGQPILLDEQ